MLTTRVVHPDILYHLAKAGHGAKVLITDGNYPVTTRVKSSVPVVFLNLAPGQVGVMAVFEALVAICNMERAEVMWPDDDHRPPIFDSFEKALPSIELAPLSRDEFYLECSTSENLAFVIVTGEIQPYANLLLTIGVSN